MAWAASRPRAAWSAYARTCLTVGVRRDDELPQRLALEKLGDDVGRAVVGAHVEDGENVRVVQGGDGAGLTLEKARRRVARRSLARGAP